MVIDHLKNAAVYASVHERMNDALHYLRTTDLDNIAPGRYVIDGDDIFAIVQEYDTLDAAGEQMESHRKYVDVQYMIRGEELVGHALLAGQAVSKEYDAKEDFMLYADQPSFFTKLAAGTFMIFFPTDLHMPCIRPQQEAMRVKKVVIKIKLDSEKR